MQRSDSLHVYLFACVTDVCVFFFRRGLASRVMARASSVLHSMGDFGPRHRSHGYQLQSCCKWHARHNNRASRRCRSRHSQAFGCSHCLIVLYGALLPGFKQIIIYFMNELAIAVNTRQMSLKSPHSSPPPPLPPAAEHCDSV